MNWDTQTEDKLGNLPTHEGIRESGDFDNYWGHALPYRRINRWIESQEGKHIDFVIHKFVKLNWLPQQHRTLNDLRRYIEFDTFMESGKVCYYPRYIVYWHKKVPYCFVENDVTNTIYIHPVTRLVTIYRAPRRESWKKRHQVELDAKVRIIGEYEQFYKKDGVWYQVKASIIRSPTNLKPHDIILETTRGFLPSFKVILKRQLNHKELKKHSLKNG